MNKYTLRSKIWEFFKKIFFKENEPKILIQEGEIKKEKSIFQEENVKHNLAEKLRKNEVEIDDLTDAEINQMRDYFKKDIIKVDREIERVKMNILRIQKKLRN